MHLNLSTPIENLYMVGRSYAARLNKGLNIHTIEDLLYHFPFRYEDLSLPKKIDELTIGEKVTLQGQMLELKNIYTRSGKQIQQGYFTDGKNTIRITWFNQPYLIKTLPPGIRINLAGKVESFSNKLTLISPAFEFIKSYQPFEQTIHTGRLVPVYPETYGVSSKWLRSRIKPLIKRLSIQDWLPNMILKQERFLDLKQAIKNIHFPAKARDIEKARLRLGFDELFLLQLKAQKRKLEWSQQQLRHKIKASQINIKPFIQKLPFKLTDDQVRTLNEIIVDLSKDQPMNRLIEGDVGSGKTVVAAAAIYLMHKHKLKATLMAPTEVLANQHYRTLSGLLTPFRIRIGFYTSEKKSNQRLDKYDLYLGTHALLFQNLPHTQIGLVIIDEQHRFGVKQRSELIGKPNVPHVLTMTATPIPRTVALALYGELSLSAIKTMPKGRKIIKTWVVPKEKRQASLNWIKEQIKSTSCQVYFIYPLIDPSDKTLLTNVKAAKKEYEVICHAFKEFNVGLLHGRLKGKQKSKIMDDFLEKKLHILVSTSVIEVGIDVPNASIIVIEGAERFGLSQLHQLRGRVGRDDKQAYCLLFPSTENLTENKRLKAMEKIQSGIELSELDLKLRGPGELFGTLQSGYQELRIASFKDTALINTAQRWAVKLVDKLGFYPLLLNKLTKCKIADIKPN